MKLKPDEKIPDLPGTTVGDFWSWAYSDMLSNANRGVFAEFLVAAALGVTDHPRIEWDAFDVLYRGHGIEVKASAYVQTWQQKRLSRISFDIGQKRSWFSDTNTYSAEATRPADCYVFCLFAETDRKAVRVLDLSQWRFYVLSTAALEKAVGLQKSIGLSALESLCAFVSYTDLQAKIDSALDIDGSD